MSYREGRFWQPDVTVATVVVRDGRLLLVEQRAPGRLVYTQPAGHLEPDESLLDAARRAEPVTLTLCGERCAQTWVNAPHGAGARLGRLFKKLLGREPAWKALETL